MGAVAGYSKNSSNRCWAAGRWSGRCGRRRNWFQRDSRGGSATGGLPRGCLTEIFGAASSGRTSLLVSILAAATARRGSLRAGGCRRRLRSGFRRRGRRGLGALALGSLRPQRRARAQSRGPADPGRRLRRGGDGSGRYAARHGAPHLAHLLVPLAPRRGAYAHRAVAVARQSERQNLRHLDAGMRAGRSGVGRHLAGRLLRGMRVQVARRKPVRAAGASFYCGWNEEKDDKKRSSVLLV